MAEALLETIVAERSTSWRSQAACRGMYGLFHPSSYQPTTVQVAWAKAICASCVVVEPCLAEADADGIWGGTTPRERGRRWGGRRARTLATAPAAPVAPSVPAASPAAEADAQIDEAIEWRTGWVMPTPVAEQPAPMLAVAPAIDQALRTLTRHGAVALRSRTDTTEGVISRRAGRALRDDGLIERDRTVDLTGPCWILTQAGRDLAAALQAKHKEPAP